MRAEGTFAVASYQPTDVTPAVDVALGVDVGVATMEKAYAGEVIGRSGTLFSSAFDPARGIGTYVAIEAFEGSLGGVEGTFAFAHAATTTGGNERLHELLVIVPGSGTGGLAGIEGGGGMAVEPDGTHRIWFDYSLPSGP